MLEVSVCFIDDCHIHVIHRYMPQKSFSQSQVIIFYYIMICIYYNQYVYCNKKLCFCIQLEIVIIIIGRIKLHGYANCLLPVSYEPHRKKTGFSHMRKKKTQITAKLISAFVFAKKIVQSLYFLYVKFQASSHLL